MKDDTLTIEITIKRSELANPAIADAVIAWHKRQLATLPEKT